MSEQTVEQTQTNQANDDTNNQPDEKAIGVVQRWYQLTDRLKQIMLAGLIHVASFSAKNPVSTIVTCIMVSILIMVLGLMTNFEIENDGTTLWTPTDCVSEIHGDWIASSKSGFPPPPRQVQVIIHANGDNILGLEGISRLFEVMDTIRFTPGYHELCELEKTNINQECPIYSSTGFWAGHNGTLFRETTITDEEAIYALSQLQYANKEPVDRSLVFGQPMPPLTGKLSDLVSSNVTMVPLESLTALMTTVAIPPFEDEALEFEDDVTNRLFNLYDRWKSQEPKTPFVLELQTARSFDDELSRSIQDDIPLMAAAFVVMGVFCSIVLGKWHAVKSQSVLGLGAVATIVLSLFSGYGLMFCLGVPFTSLTQIFPYVMVGIGLDNTFIITGAISRTDPKDDVVQRIVDTIKDIGVSISVSTMTTFVAFMLSGVSSVPGMRWFAWYAGPTVAIDFVYQVTFFIAILAIDEKRQLANRRDCCPCCIAKRPSQPEDEGDQTEQEDPKESLASRMVDGYATLLLHPVSKVFVIVSFLAMLVLGAFGASKQDQDFDWRTLVPPDSYLEDFFSALDTYIGQQANVLFLAQCYFRDIDVSQPANQDAVFDYIDDMVGLEYVNHAPVNFWLRDLLFFTNQTDEIQDMAFYDQLDVFLSTEPYSELYKTDIVRNEENVVTASRTLIAFDNVDPYNNEAQIDALKAEQQAASQQPLNSNKPAEDWTFFSHGEIYQAWELYDVIIYEVILTVSLGLTTVFTVALVFLPHPFGAFVVTPAVAAIYVELLGLLYVNDISVNSISAVGLTMSIGLVVDYNMHILLTFFETDRPTRAERVRAVINTMGKSVMLGGFSTFLGILPLSLSSSDIFETFFVTFMGIVFLGVGHGLVLVPVVLSICGPHKVPELPPNSWQVGGTKDDKTSTDERNLNAEHRPREDTKVYSA